jgi:hypothetical protein
MRKAAFAVSLALLASLLPSSVHAWGRGGFGRHGFHGDFHGHAFGRGFGFRGFGFRGPRFLIGFGPALWWGPAYGVSWYSPLPYSAYGGPGVVGQPSTVYVEQGPSAPPAPSSWYYCQSADAYYPDVRTCEEPWVRVPTTPR